MAFRTVWRFWFALVLLGMLAACRPPAMPETFPVPMSPTATAYQPLAPTAIILPTSTPTMTPTPLPRPVWFPEGLSWTLQGWTRVPDPNMALVRLNLEPAQPEGFRVFVLAVPAFTWAPWVTAADLRAYWQGRDVPAFGPSGLLMTQETLAWLRTLFGEPAPNRVRVVPPEGLLAEARGASPGWTILPFDRLTPDWRVVPINGLSPMLPGFRPEGYPLALPFAWEGPPHATNAWRTAFPVENYNPNQLTRVALTGVTALVRATAYTMEQRGITYPAQDVGTLLQSMDITHISNEVPFDPTCPPPNPVQPDLKFCSDPRYIALLEAVGTDVVELTGDHFNDRGPEAVRYTVRMYRDRGWAYYGGGLNLTDAQRAARFEHHGNRIAFLGCNAKGGGYATAGPDRPGAWACDWNEMTRLVRQEREAGYLPIVTFQHQELYMFDPPEDFKADFRRMVDAGAVIVSGSQAHHPHGMERYAEGFIHYGLGNLFFDQKGMVPNGDWGFIDVHVFYQERYLGMTPVVIRFVDFARPVLLPWDEARPLVEQVYAVSRWNLP